MNDDGPRLKVARLLPALDFGGVESRVVLQAQGIDRDRFDFRVVAFHHAGQAAERIRAAGIPVDILGTSPSIRSVRAPLALAAWLRRERPDVLHASIAEANQHAAVAGSLCRISARILEEVGVPVRSVQGRVLQGVAARLAHRVVGVTQATVDWLAANERIPRHKLALVYNCGKPQFFGPVTRGMRKPGPLRIFTAGRLVWQKDHPTLVRAFAKARADGLDAELWIAGDGPLKAELDAVAHGVGGVKLLGYREDIRALLDDVDLFVLPSVSEGCSVALIEAMASGIPCLASDIPGNAEVIGAQGWLPPAGDVAAWAVALHRFAALPALARAEMGMRGREIAIDRFSPDVYLRTVERLYRDTWRERTQ